MTAAACCASRWYILPKHYLKKAQHRMREEREREATVVSEKGRAEQKAGPVHRPPDPTETPPIRKDGNETAVTDLGKGNY